MKNRTNEKEKKIKWNVNELAYVVVVKMSFNTEISVN